eukprot:CAMPEP_0177632776 /NCGR_PEP_ID=MMETSP0447-20121125/2485_1 /TAXON_ID=0 /ORGANISM="Stygamoeba regulata, Strain BSH-02190019" /LENGTH=166 /DNA_ID=CAMNT_0019134393 /DNA_START=75 /DNA_END=575 /DNA_ORIENTATION=-
MLLRALPGFARCACVPAFAPARMAAFAPAHMTALPAATNLMTKRLVATGSEATKPPFNSFSTQAKLNHTSVYAMLLTFPVALAYAPASYILDPLLSVGIVVHSHLCLGNVLNDYVHRSLQGASKVLLWIMSIVVFVGLAKLNIFGSGLTNTIKELWVNDRAAVKEK